MDYKGFLLFLAVVAIFLYVVATSPNGNESYDAILDWALQNDFSVLELEKERYSDRLRYAISAMQKIHRIKFKDNQGKLRRGIVIYGDLWRGNTLPIVRYIEK